MADLPTVQGSRDTGRGLPLSAWLLLVAIVYATIAQGAFHRDQFRLVLVLLVLAAGDLALRRSGRDWAPLPALAAVAFGAIGISVVATGADLGSALPTVALVAAVLIAIAVVLAVDDLGVERLVDGVIICGLIASATAWIGVAFHRDPWGLVVQGIWRGSSTLTYANATAALAGVALLLALGRILASANRLAGLPAYALGVGLLCTGSRAGGLSVAIGVVVLARRLGWVTTARAVVPVAVGGLVAGAGLLPSVSADGGAHPGIAMGGVVLGAVVAVVLSPAGRRADGPLAWSSLVLAIAGLAFLATNGSGAVDRLTAARFDLRSEDRAAEWGAAGDEFRASPLFGRGPGRLELSWSDEDGRTYVAAFAHNEYLELLATQGLFGLAALAACGAIVVTHRRRRADRSPVDDAAVAALAVLAVHSGFDFLWHIPVLALVGGVLMGVLARAPAAHPPSTPVVPALPLARETESCP